MEAPKEIYLDPVKLKESEITYIDTIVPEGRVESGDIKYIRTDLVELTEKQISALKQGAYLLQVNYQYGDAEVLLNIIRNITGNDIDSNSLTPNC